MSQTLAIAGSRHQGGGLLETLLDLFVTLTDD